MVDDGILHENTVDTHQFPHTHCGNTIYYQSQLGRMGTTRELTEFCFVCIFMTEEQFRAYC